MSENENSKKLLLALLYANTEAEVDAIIQGDAEMSDESNWHPLDGRDTNQNTTGGQSSNGAKAATELMTNMVDAILMKMCNERGIDPRGDDAPRTMYEAVDKLVFHKTGGLGGGKIVKEDRKVLKSYAEENLIISINGGKKASDPNPCFTFCDNGEGQHPERFVDTFLSLSAKNKSEIPFVQGKYNMGSSGVLKFCGDNGYKLILSRRHEKNGAWGWTLIRKKTPDAGLDYAVYFAPGDEVKSFDLDTPLNPLQTSKGEVYPYYSMESGTVVKLYEYYLGKEYRGINASRQAFDENLVETILPFRIWDFRNKYEKGRGKEREYGLDSRPFNGLEFSLCRNYAEELETDGEEDLAVMPIDTIKDPKLGTIRISAVLIERENQPDWYVNSSKCINRVFHHVNGQVQYKDTRGYLTQCEFQALKDRVAIFVDASDFIDRAQQLVWQSDRERISETPLGDHYKREVKEAIKNSALLKRLNHEIATEQLESATKDNSKKLVKELVQRDENLKLILTGGVPGAVVPGKKTTAKEGRRDLKRNPSYIKLKGKNVIETPINRKRPIEFETDAEDTFLSRPDNRGDLTFSSEDVEGRFGVNVNLSNGKLMLFLKPYAEKVHVGGEYCFKVCLKSPEMSDAKCIEDYIHLQIMPPQNKPKNIREKKKISREIGLPPHFLLTKDGREVMGEKTMKWSDFHFFDKFGELDGGYVNDLGEEGGEYYINYDNSFFQRYLQSMKGGEEVAKKKYVLGMRILMLSMESAIKRARERHKTENFTNEEDNFRRAIADGAAAVILTLCDQMPNSFNLFDDSPEDSSDA